MEFKQLLPSIFLPTFLRNALGYRTHAMVSMPVLNPHTVINRDFDTYELMPNHNDMARDARRDEFDDDAADASTCSTSARRTTPTRCPTRTRAQWPRISGVHGVFKRLDEIATHADTSARRVLRPDEAATSCTTARSRAVELPRRRVRASCSTCCRTNTWMIVTSDHGELFGEDGYFGHGPIMHEKCFEVPFVEGKLR